MSYEWIMSGQPLIAEVRAMQTPKDVPVIWYIGQMGLLIKFNETLLYVDPVLNDLTDKNGMTRRNYAPPFAPDAMTDIDYVFCSHNHADHLALETLLPLYAADPNVQFIVPAPHVQVLTDAGIPAPNVIGARDMACLSLDGFCVYPIAAAHEEYLCDEHGDHCCLGYIFEMGGCRLYHSGDTVVTTQLTEQLSSLPFYDAVFLPINGRDEERHRRNIIGNMDYREAADLANAIHARSVVPMHYDMMQGNGEDPQRFTDYMDERYPGCRYKVMQLGEYMVM